MKVRNVIDSLNESELEDLKLVNKHRRGEESLEDTAREMLTQGCRNMISRYERNKAKWQETKQLRARVRQLEAQLGSE